MGKQKPTFVIISIFMTNWFTNMPLKCFPKFFHFRFHEWMPFLQCMWRNIRSGRRDRRPFNSWLIVAINFNINIRKMMPNYVFKIFKKSFFKAWFLFESIDGGFHLDYSHWLTRLKNVHVMTHILCTLMCHRKCGGDPRFHLEMQIFELCSPTQIDVQKHKTHRSQKSQQQPQDLWPNIVHTQSWEQEKEIYL